MDSEDNEKCRSSLLRYVDSACFEAKSSRSYLVSPAERSFSLSTHVCGTRGSIPARLSFPDGPVPHAPVRRGARASGLHQFGRSSTRSRQLVELSLPFTSSREFAERMVA